MGLFGAPTNIGIDSQYGFFCRYEQWNQSLEQGPITFGDERDRKRSPFFLDTDW